MTFAKRTSSIDREDAVARLNAGICPFCGSGPYKLVSGHIFQIHGVPINTLKDELLLSRSQGFVSPETRELYRERALDNGFGEKGKAPIKAIEAAKKKRNKQLIAKKIEHSPEFNRRRQHAANLMKCEKVKRKNVESRQRNGNQFNGSKAGNTSRYGTSDGYPDSFYVKISEEFMSEIIKYGGTRIYKRLSEIWGIHPQNAKRRVLISVSRGFLILRGSRKSLTGELTPKAIQFNGESS